MLGLNQYGWPAGAVNSGRVSVGVSELAQRDTYLGAQSIRAAEAAQSSLGTEAEVGVHHSSWVVVRRAQQLGAQA